MAGADTVTGAAHATRRGTRRSSAVAGVLLALSLAWLGVELHALAADRSMNSAILRGDLAGLAREETAMGYLARAWILHDNGQLEEALATYARASESDDPQLREVLGFNLANLYLARAVEYERREEKQLSISLIEQAKQNYRELLARNPAHWDARYNLSRALEMLPDLDDVQYGNEMNPERSPQAPQADTAHDRLP